MLGGDLISFPTPEEHPVWLETKRQELLRLLGGFPVHSPLRPATVRRKEEAERIVELVQYETEPGEKVSAILMIPRHRTPPLPAVLCHHQHAGQYTLGKSEPAGLAGDPRQAFAAELCARGYITLSPDAVGFEDRRDPHFDGEEGERFLAHELLLKGATLQGKLIWDVRRAVDYLFTRPEIDRTRLGMMGHGLGGTETWFSLPFEPRLKAGVASCGTSTFAALLSARAVHPCGLYVPNLLHWGDVPDIVSMSAPRPLLLLAGKEDWRFPLGGVKDVLARARMMYQRLGAAEAVELYVSQGVGELSEEMRSRAYNWLDRWV